MKTSKCLASFSIIAFGFLCCAAHSKEDKAPVEDQNQIDKISSVKSNTVSQKFPSVCPTDMVEIKGNYCPSVEENCKEYLDEHQYACKEFQYPTKCLSKTLVPIHICMDKYEIPDKKGELPTIMMSWYDVKNFCESQGKRMCMDYEWTFAAEGNDILPYPYGYKRDSSACNIDKPQKPGFDFSKQGMTPELVKYLDQRVPSGSMPKCVSPFGVYDMTGNADEWTVNSSGKPYVSAFKGGHWVKSVRNAARPATISHSPDFKEYVSSGRCCLDLAK